MSHYNVLFLCTGNSARSIMAEAIMKRKGMPTFTAYSAGSHPFGSVRPEALTQIKNAGLSTEGFRSKSWNEFSSRTPPRLISFSPSAITQRTRSVLCGLGSP